MSQTRRKAACMASMCSGCRSSFEKSNAEDEGLVPSASEVDPRMRASGLQSLEARMNGMSAISLHSLIGASSIILVPLSLGLLLLQCHRGRRLRLSQEVVGQILFGPMSQVRPCGRHVQEKRAVSRITDRAHQLQALRCVPPVFVR